MLYDIPARTGRKIAASTTIDLVASHSNIVAMKDASGDLVEAAHYKAVLGDDIDLYSGDDSVVLPFMAIGAVGLVSVAAHWAAREFVQLVESVERGDWVAGAGVQRATRAELRLRGQRAVPEPDAHQGGAALSRVRRRPVPTPALGE